jgi:hypothetical protein
VVAQDRRSEDLELLVVLANILGLLVAGPPVLDLDLCTSVCVSSRTETETVCLFLVVLKAGGQSKFPHVQTFQAVCGRESQQQAQLYTSKTGCESTCVYRDVHTHMCIYIYMYMSMYIYTYIYTSLHIYIYIHTLPSVPLSWCYTELASGSLWS